METGLTKQDSQLPALLITSNLTQVERYFLELRDSMSIAQYEKTNAKDKNSGYAGAELARYLIGQSLEQIYEMIGLQRDRWPGGPLAKKIAKFIQDTYGFITPQELIDTVTFALQEKFPTVINNISILECHGTMDLLWIKNLLSAYVKWRYENKLKAEQKIEKIEEAAHLTPEQVLARKIKSDAAVKQIISDCFKAWTEKEEHNPWEPLMAGYFPWLVDIGLIEYDRQWLNEKFKAVKENNLKWGAVRCQEYVKVLAVLNGFAKLREQENPFEIFNRICYVETTIQNRESIYSNITFISDRN